MPAHPNSPEEAASAVASSGDGATGSRSRAEAVSRLFRDHNRTLVRLLHAKLQNEQEARETAQEAYVRLLELERTGAVSFLRAYLFRIALNLAIDRIRSRNQRQRIDSVKLQPIEDLIGQAVVDQHVLAEDEVRVFRASLRELEEPYGQAFLLSRVDGLSTREIAHRLGKSERMVRRYVVHAMLYCRHRLDGLTPAQAKERMSDE